MRASDDADERRRTRERGGWITRERTGARRVVGECWW